MKLISGSVYHYYKNDDDDGDKKYLWRDSFLISCGIFFMKIFV
jgi:hypothetical protein